MIRSAALWRCRSLTRSSAPSEIAQRTPRHRALHALNRAQAYGVRKRRRCSDSGDYAMRSRAQRARRTFSDEAGALEAQGHMPLLIKGHPRNFKVTYPEDVEWTEAFLSKSTLSSALRIGQGYDIHALTAGRPLIIGGVTIPFERGLRGHSD